MNKVKVIPVWDKTYEEWLEIRKGGIGGSDAGTIVGVNKYQSPYSLWGEKTGIAPRDFGGNEATKWGNRLERIVADAYAEDYNKAVVEWPVILWSQEPGQEFMFANLDFVVVEPTEEFPSGVVTKWLSEEPPAGVLNILEVKTSGIASPGNPAGWANNGIPQSYMLQAYHYGLVTGWTDNVTFAALIAGQGLQVRHMDWDPSVAENLVAAESLFSILVETQTAPEVDGSEATESAQQARFPRHEAGKGYEGGLPLAALWDEFTEAKVAAEKADAHRKSLRANIVEMVGNAEFATVDGNVILTYRSGKDVDSLDTERLKREAPEVFEQFKKTRPGSRTLRGVK